MLKAENISTDKNKVSSAQKTTEDKAIDVIEENEESEEEELLIVENDGDFFWVLQRVVWGTIKGILLLMLMGIIIWFIWEGDDSLVKNLKGQIKIKKINTEGAEKVEPVIDKNDYLLNGEEVSTYSLKIVEKAYQLENERIEKASTILSASIVWLKKAKSLGDISMVVLRIEDPSVRAKKIEDTLVQADKALEESAYLQKKLSIEIASLLRKKQQFEKDGFEIDNQIFTKISKYESNGIEELLVQKIAKEKELVSVAESGKIREILLRNVQNFDILLRTKWIPLVRPTEMIGVKGK